MKPVIEKRPVAKLPNLMAENMQIEVSNVVALKTLLFSLYKGQKSGFKQEGSDKYSVSFTIKEALPYLNDAMFFNQDYSRWKKVSTQLGAAKIFVSENSNFYLYFVFNSLEFDRETKTLKLTFSDFFSDLLYECYNSNFIGFTLVNLKDAAQIQSSRLLRFFIWASRFSRLKSDFARTLDVEVIKLGLGLQGDHYKDWRRVKELIDSLAKEVGERTPLQVKIVPVKPDGVRVKAVRFDVRDTQLRIK